MSSVSTTPCHRLNTTAVILAGGAAQRMQGLEKGLQHYRDGLPLIDHVLACLSSQVNLIAINNSRSASDYATRGFPVWADSRSGYEGPLAGIETALMHGTTPYLITTPCDTPNLPHNLHRKMADALNQSGCAIAVAATVSAQHSCGEANTVDWHPTCLLMAAQRFPSLLASVSRSLDQQQRSIRRWIETQSHTVVVFDDADAFYNVNYPAQLMSVQRSE